jgi:hypothetical protein
VEWFHFGLSNIPKESENFVSTELFCEIGYEKGEQDNGYSAAEEARDQYVNEHVTQAYSGQACGRHVDEILFRIG